MKQECKVKIGSAYEPRWFERRATQGTYSGKNVPLDNDEMWLQNALLGNKATSFWKTKIAITVVSIVVILYFAWVYGVFK
jgi:hypothetical protein